MPVSNRISVDEPGRGGNQIVNAHLMRDAKVQAAERNMSLNAWIQEAIDHTMRFKRSYLQNSMRDERTRIL
jgi:hypothetical protein